MQYAEFNFSNSYRLYLFPLKLQGTYKKPKRSFAFITLPNERVHDKKIFIGTCLYDIKSKYIRLGDQNFTFQQEVIIPNIILSDLGRFSAILKIGMEEVIHDDWEMQPAEKLLTHQSDLIRSFVGDIIRKELQTQKEDNEN